MFYVIAIYWTNFLDNTEVKYGQPSQSIFLANQTSIGFIESPRYPESYPRSVVKNYTLVNVNTAGYVRLIFDDFHVHFQSELKVGLFKIFMLWVFHLLF